MTELFDIINISSTQGPHFARIKSNPRLVDLVPSASPPPQHQSDSNTESPTTPYHSSPIAMAPHTRKLGKNGPEVTALGFGTMGLSSFYGAPKPDKERFAMLDHIYDAGERFWDTADMYGDSEDLLGQWFKNNPGKRENIFLATKFGNFVDPKTGARSVRNEPEYVRQACDKSLRRLGVDQIDLYYAHRLNASQPVETTVKAMKELQDQGKVKYLGLSECSADSLRRACKVSNPQCPIRTCGSTEANRRLLGGTHRRRPDGIQPLFHGRRGPPVQPAERLSRTGRGAGRLLTAGAGLPDGIHPESRRL